MRQLLYIILFFGVNLMSFSQGNSDLIKLLSKPKQIENFDSLKIKHKLLHFPQTNFSRVYPHKYKSIIYQYACKNIELDIEIRHLIFDLNTCSKKSDKESNWEHIAKSNFETILHKVAKKGTISKSSLIPYSDRRELCSFWGITSDFAPNKRFSTKYQYVAASSVINVGKSQIITFVLHNEHQQAKELFSPYFYSLSFCKPREVIYHEINNSKKEAYPGEKDFYINSTRNGLLIRKEDMEIKSVFVTITDNMAKIYFQDRMEGKFLSIKTLKEGEYIIKINYDGKQFRRIVNVFFEE